MRQNKRFKQRGVYRSGRLLSFVLVVVVAVFGSGFFYSGNFAARFANAEFSEFTKKASCNIKGNVSYNNDRKIYHVPGQKDYKKTKISSHRGERWFCSEADARAEGWRKAGR